MQSMQTECRTQLESCYYSFGYVLNGAPTEHRRDTDETSTRHRLGTDGTPIGHRKDTGEMISVLASATIKDGRDFSARDSAKPIIIDEVVKPIRASI